MCYTPQYSFDEDIEEFNMILDRISSLFTTHVPVYVLRDLCNLGVIAGGSVVFAMNNFVPKDSIGDVDIFLRTADDFQQALSLIRSNFPSAGLSIPCNSGYYGMSVLNIKISQDDIPFQLIYKKWSDPNDLISKFDLDYVQCGIFNCSIFRTEECRESHKERRVIRYWGRDFRDCRSLKAIKKGFSCPLFLNGTLVDEYKESEKKNRELGVNSRQFFGNTIDTSDIPINRNIHAYDCGLNSEFRVIGDEDETRTDFLVNQNKITEGGPETRRINDLETNDLQIFEDKFYYDDKGRPKKPLMVDDIEIVDFNLSTKFCHPLGRCSYCPCTFGVRFGTNIIEKYIVPLRVDIENVAGDLISIKDYNTKKILGHIIDETETTLRHGPQCLLVKAYAIKNCQGEYDIKVAAVGSIDNALPIKIRDNMKGISKINQK